MSSIQPQGGGTAIERSFGGAQNPLKITASSYFQQVGNVVSLYVNNTVVQSWTLSGNSAGQPVGLLLALTYPS